MELLYQGFDGLDLSFAGQITSELCAELEEAKEYAQQSRSATPVLWNGVRMLVSESGARGGYAFLVSTGEQGATWFFKKPNARDPWGIRVSCASLNLALNGVGGVRAGLYATLDRLGVKLETGSESLSRVDYAMDFLAPDFTLAPEHFVMHSNAGWAGHTEPPETIVHGRSARVSSVTIGKMPGRQVIVYDKRADVIAKHKVSWWEIWDAARLRQGKPALNRQDPTKSRVWRLELRAGKHHLKEKWNIVTWNDLDCRFGDIISASLDAVRHVQPAADSNRSRWPESELWQQARRESDRDLVEMASQADPVLLKQVQADAHDRLLASMMVGLLTTRAALRGVSISQLAAFATEVGSEMSRDITRARFRFERKLADARARYDLGMQSPEA